MASIVLVNDVVGKKPSRFNSFEISQMWTLNFGVAADLNMSDPGGKSHTDALQSFLFQNIITKI